MTDRSRWNWRDPGPRSSEGSDRSRRREQHDRGRFVGEYFGEGASGDWDWRNAGPYTGVGPRGYQRPDRRIREELCERLTMHGLIDARDIHVRVDQGEVVLAGRVESRREKQMVEEVAESVSGVTGIQNQLRVGIMGEDRSRRREGAPERWREEVGKSGVYPASEMEAAPDDAEAQGMSSWGQGERGAAGYEDSGESELNLRPEEGRGEE